MLILIILGLFLIVFFFFFTTADRRTMLTPSKSIEIDGITRTFRTYSTPLDNSQPVRIIIALHQLGGNGREIAYYSALHNDMRENTIIVYPDAVKANKGECPGWNADFCCGSGWKQQVDDKKFIETLIDTLTSQYKTKNNKVLLVGFSNGAIFAQKLASELPDKIAGFASVAGSIGVNDDEHIPKKPVPALLLYGLKDKTIPVDGGPSVGDPDFNWKSLAYTEAAWKKANQCRDSLRRDTDEYTEKNYTECAAPLVIRTDLNNGHQWPDWRLFNIWHKHSSGSQYILDFLYSL